MEARKLVFPIVLAMAWVVMAAMAIVDFASFSAATQAPKSVVAEVQTEPPAPAPLQVF